MTLDRRSVHVSRFQGTDSSLMRQRYITMCKDSTPERKYSGGAVALWRVNVWVQVVPVRWILFRLRKQIDDMGWRPVTSIRTKTAGDISHGVRDIYYLTNHRGDMIKPAKSLFDNPMLWADFQVSTYLRQL